MLQQLFVGHVRAKLQVFVVENGGRGKPAVARLDDFSGWCVFAAHQQDGGRDEPRVRIGVGIVQIDIATGNGVDQASCCARGQGIDANVF